MDVEGRVTAFGILGVPVVSQISNTPQQTHTLGEPVHLWRHVYRHFLRMKASESVQGDKSGEPLIARCYLGGGRGRGGGDSTVSLLVPLWTRWDNNDGVWEVCGWGRGVCAYQPPQLLLLLSLPESPGRFLYGCFVEGGDSQTGPQRRVCPAEQSHLMSSACLGAHTSGCVYPADHLHVPVWFVSFSYMQV